jgi:hypothetical protein
MSVIKTQLATLAYCAETDFSIQPESSVGTRIEVVRESLGPVTENSLFGEGIEGYLKNASLRHVSVTGSLEHYLRSNIGIDLLKAALRGKVTTTGSGPYTHSILPAGRDYSFTFQRQLVDNVQLYLGCRVASAKISIPADGWINASFDLLGVKEELPEAAIFTSLDSSSEEPFFSIDASLSIEGAEQIGFISADINCALTATVGRFGPNDQRAKEIWLSDNAITARVTLFEDDLNRLGWEREEDLREIMLLLDNGTSSILLSIAKARIVQVSRPFIAAGSYAQSIEVVGTEEGSLPIEVTVVNDQSTL